MVILGGVTVILGGVEVLLGGVKVYKTNIEDALGFVGTFTVGEDTPSVCMGGVDHQRSQRYYRQDSGFQGAELAQQGQVGGQDVISLARYGPSEEGGHPRKGRVITMITQ